MFVSIAATEPQELIAFFVWFNPLRIRQIPGQDGAVQPPPLRRGSCAWLVVLWCLYCSIVGLGDLGLQGPYSSRLVGFLKKTDFSGTVQSMKARVFQFRGLAKESSCYGVTGRHDQPVRVSLGGRESADLPNTQLPPSRGSCTPKHHSILTQALCRDGSGPILFVSFEQSAAEFASPTLKPAQAESLLWIEERFAGSLEGPSQGAHSHEVFRDANWRIGKQPIQPSIRKRCT